MAYLKVKGTVQPKILMMMAAIANVAQNLDEPVDVLVTSGNDSKHMVGSKHYTYEALDIRSKNFPSAIAKQHFMNAVLKRLGSGYQMILESEGQANEHMHLNLTLIKVLVRPHLYPLNPSRSRSNHV